MIQTIDELFLELHGKLKLYFCKQDRVIDNIKYLGYRSR